MQKILTISRKHYESVFSLHGYSREKFLLLNLRDLDVPEFLIFITGRIVCTGGKTKEIVA